MDHCPRYLVGGDISKPGTPDVDRDPRVEAVDVHDVPLNGADTDSVFLGRQRRAAGAAEKRLEISPPHPLCCGSCRRPSPSARWVRAWRWRCSMRSASSPTSSTFSTSSLRVAEHEHIKRVGAPHSGARWPTREAHGSLRVRADPGPRHPGGDGTHPGRRQSCAAASRGAQAGLERSQHRYRLSRRGPPRGRRPYGGARGRSDPRCRPRGPGPDGRSHNPVSISSRRARSCCRKSVKPSATSPSGGWG
jgi:hypothetical protein